MPLKDKGKGKARAEPTERDPLLPSSSRLPHVPDEAPPQRTGRFRSVLLTALIVVASLFLSAILFIALLAYSFKPSERELEQLPKTAFAYAGPDNVQVLNVTDDGILVNVSVRCGIDVDSAMGLSRLDPAAKAEAAERGDRGTGAEWWESLRRWSAYRALDQLPARAIQVNVSDPIFIFPKHFDSPPLLSLRILDDLFIPLVADVDPKSAWLKPVSFLALAKPIATTGQLWEFVQHAWLDGEAKVVVGISHVEVKVPGGNAWWAKYAQGEKDDLVMGVQVPVPHLPGLPVGRPLNLSQLVHLDSYSFSTDQADALTIVAHASLPNPLTNITTTIPFPVPFSIALSDGSRMAEVLTEPIEIHPSRHLNLTMSGRILANLSQDSAADHDSPLSGFLQKYLHGMDNPIIVTGLSQIPSFANVSEKPPSWLLQGLSSLSLPLIFPGPRPPPRIIQSVTIEHMRISERAGKMRASGTVVAEIELPPAMQTVDVDVVEVLPDVLVYDGLAGDEDADPDDPPPRAFGHIQPDEFLDATTELSTDPEHPHRLIVSAPLTDVPLEVLPGRDSIFREFVSKVVFKGGAQAGVKGTASVRVELVGVNGRVRLDNLPVKGEFWVGRQR